MSEFRAGFVGLVGLPNAGKSSFMNHILKEKVSIVSSKPQATRRRVSGIMSLKNAQIIFSDSPGFLTQSKSAMTKYISSEAQEVIKDVDVILLLIPCNQAPSPELAQLFELVRQSKKPWGVCITKLDLKPADDMLPLLKQLQEEKVPLFEFSTVKPSQQSLEEMYAYLGSVLPTSGAPLYDEDIFTTENLRDLAAEFIREPCFEFLEQEIPFGIGIRINKFDEQPKITRIEATILVEKENHKAIVIGKGGIMLKKIGQYARQKIEELLQKKVYLGLHVAHKESWTKKRAFMQELGYEHKS